MRYALILLAGLSVAACEGDAVGAKGTPAAHKNSAANVGVTVSIPDTMTADANGVCDLPMATSSSVVAEFGDTRLTLNYGATADTFPVNYSQMADVVWPIPVGTASGVFYDSELSAHPTAPYHGSWALKWIVAGVDHFGTVTFECIP